MAKHDKGVGQKMTKNVKAKGLQKLKWFCQMCQKQCRDQNGFKCHLTSEAHQRQLLLFSENSHEYLREFNKEFESAFLKILKFTYGTKRVRANDVYQDYIRDRSNVHMNATSWHSLTGFIHYLAKTGKAKVDENEKGWWIQYVDKEAEIRKKQMLEKVKVEKDDEEKERELFMKRLEREKVEEKEVEKKEFNKADGEIIKIKLALEPSSSKDIPKVQNVGNIFASLDSKEKKSSSGSNNTLKRTAIDEIMEIEERKREKKFRRDYWICTNIIVKIITKKLGKEYYKEKGNVVEVIDQFTGKVELDNGDLIKIDQKYLETVIPSVGKEMRIVNGAYRGCKGELLKILEKEFKVQIKINEGLDAGKVVEVAYEDASKLYL
uniref:Kin17_mid domain-containing protein n=1 Tax=Parastrongyloides trichosuri TaxID=131310 RepID=A0A0N4ZE66_PARTI